MIWARAVHPEVPIIHSNAPVESSWSVMKKNYIRKGSRPKPELLIDIVMNLYLPRLITLVKEHRNLRDPGKPTWYSILFLNIANSFNQVSWFREEMEANVQTD
jgi:hypothetical protein